MKTSFKNSFVHCIDILDIMKKLLILLFLVPIVSCSSDDDSDSGNQCLVCSSFGANDITSDELAGFCVGANNPESGETVTLEMVTTYKALLNALGAECTIE